MSAIRPSQVQAWVDDATLGAVSVRRNVDVLAQILDLAQRDGIIKTNPARGLKLPRRPLSKQVYLTPGQLADLAGEASQRLANRDRAHGAVFLGKSSKTSAC